MKVIVMKDAAEISNAAADIIIKQVNRKHGSVIGFATGASPVETYKRIIEAYEKNEVSLKYITTFNLDEYVGLDRENVNSYFYFMKENLFGKTDVDFDRVNFLSGTAEDMDAECVRYSECIRNSGGIDIQILGIGTNGHIGFNEPGDKFADGPFAVKLTQSTIDSNKKYFEAVGDKMPEYALTMGIGTILNAKKIIILANGAAKHAAIAKMLEGKLDTSCPASMLNLHADVTVICDEAAYNG